jgi:hypothetical protein
MQARTAQEEPYLLTHLHWQEMMLTSVTAGTEIANLIIARPVADIPKMCSFLSPNRSLREEFLADSMVHLFMSALILKRNWCMQGRGEYRSLLRSVSFQDEVDSLVAALLPVQKPGLPLPHRPWPVKRLRQAG